MNIVFWILLIIAGVIIWVSISHGFSLIGLITKSINETVKENLNKNIEFKNNKENE